VSETAFDEHAAEYDSWFLKNRNILGSEVLLLAGFLKEPGRALSVGCGSGLFEKILREDHGIDIRFGVEPAVAMAEIAVKRGMEVETGTAEELPYEDASFDTAVLNGCPSYIDDLEQAFAEAWRVLKPGGHIVVADVPAESSFGLIYQLATQIGTWDDPRLQPIAPADPYPVAFAASARWRTTEEKMALLEKVGFVDLETAQTLTVHARYAEEAVEPPSNGHQRGDYVAVRARKP
jgi:ubiquinone/menaquinone biosynthesis C-methylase UbiE